MQDLGTLPGGQYIAAQGINDAGIVVGDATTAAGLSPHAFKYEGTTMSDLGTLGGDSSSGYSINNLNQIAGSAGTATAGSHACLWSAQGVPMDLGLLPGVSVGSSRAFAINDAGVVVGESTSTGPYEHAF